MSVARHHAEWMSLVESSGPFLSMPVLLRIFPQGLDPRDSANAGKLREAYEDWLDRGAQHSDVHLAWIRHVLTSLLEYPAEFLVEGQAIPPGMEAARPNFGETLRPTFVLKHRDADKNPILLIEHYPPGQDLEKPVSEKLWKATPGTRMMELLHAAGVPLGLITNGEEWMLVSAPRGETTGFASWYADIWMQEPITLRAFHSLLHLRRFLGVAEPETLAAMYAESSKNQQEVTDQLGYQVRQAVEMLVQAFDRIDAESGRTLLAGVPEKVLYDSALTVMMRLVFLFSADERGLLLLGDPLYDQHYAVSTLSELLRERADQQGEEVLERRDDAWCRLLATFRAVHSGVQHEAMRLPAYGGTLFDPDRYPFLEGRAAGTRWETTPSKPLPINNRVVLHLLEALQVLRVKVPGGGPAEARRISFRALDIEQIGHVYEGLLDHTAKRAEETILGLVGSKNKEPEVPLSHFEEVAAKGNAALIEFLKDETGRSAKALKRLVDEPPTLDEHALLIACGQDPRLARRVKPFAALLRPDSFDRLVIIPEGSVYVTAGTDRRSSGTHYTPRSLTEGIFLRLNEERLQSWEAKPQVKQLEQEFLVSHKMWRTMRKQNPAEAGFPGIRFVLLHSLSHALMRQIALECGYTAASVRERLYCRAVGEDHGPAAGILIYTAASDSEGTLGGLVQLGQPVTLGRQLQHALESMRICGSDPLCAEHSPSADGRSVHGACCHACLFAPETSCERGNRFLDRTTLTGTFAAKAADFFEISESR